MLGLLLMAGLGFAATAIMEHVDVNASDEEDPEDEGASDDTAEGSLLEGDDSADPDDDPASQAAPVEDNSETDAQPVTDTPKHAAPAPLAKVFGSEDNDTLLGSAHNDLMEGNGGDDLLSGKTGKDNLIGFDAGMDTLFGNRGDDSLHGYLMQQQPDGTSYMIEDHEADHLHGGYGRDTLFLASDDVGSGGVGSDEFHLSWDVDHGHPAQITDYNPRQDRLFVEFTSNHADEGLTEIRPEETTLTTAPMEGGAGTAILLNGQTIAHVLGATNLQAADIGLIHA